MTFFLDILPASLAVGGGAAAGGAAAAGSLGVTSATFGGTFVAGGTAASASTLAFFGAGAGAGAGLSLSSILAGTTAVGQVIGTIGQGAAMQSQLKAEAAMMRATADQEVAAGAERARQAAREFREISAAQDAVFLANGLDIGLGTPRNVRQATKRQAERELDITRSNARNRAAARRLRSRGLMAEARSAFGTSLARTVPTITGAYEVLG